GDSRASTVGSELSGRPFQAEIAREACDLVSVCVPGKRTGHEISVGETEVSDVAITYRKVEQHQRSPRAAPDVDPPVAVPLDEVRDTFDFRGIGDGAVLPVSIPNRDHLDAVSGTQLPELEALRVSTTT